MQPSAFEKANEERLELLARKLTGEALSPAEEERLAATTAQVDELLPRATPRERKYLGKITDLTGRFQAHVKRVRSKFHLDQPT